MVDPILSTLAARSAMHRSAISLSLVLSAAANWFGVREVGTANGIVAHFLNSARCVCMQVGMCVGMWVCACTSAVAVQSMAVRGEMRTRARTAGVSEWRSFRRAPKADARVLNRDPAELVSPR